MTEALKDTVYIEVDEDITSIIDKVTGAKQKIVAVVLPKRSTAMQSIVNMRLLKKSAESANKKVVLITSDPGLMPLANAAEMYVAKNLQSKPDIPPKDIDPVPVDDGSGDESSNKEDTDQPTNATEDSSEADEEAISIGDDTEKTDTPKVDTDLPKISDLGPKLKGLKVPNFEKFRALISLGLVGVLLVVFGIYLALTSLPKATITITTDSVDVSANFNATSDSKTASVDEVKLIVPGEQKKLTKDFKEDITATGKKDTGTKATGTLTIRNCLDTSPSPASVAAGDKFTSSSGTNKGMVYISNEIKDISPATLSGGSLVCGSTTVEVTALEPGSDYNNSSTATYTSKRIGYTITGSAMSGGDSRIATILSQSDVDGAVEQALSEFTESVNEFKQQLQDESLYIFADTAKTDSGKPKPTVAVGEEADSVTVTVSPIYTVWVVKKSELSQLLVSQFNKQIDTSKLKVSGDDLSEGATVRILASDKKGISFSIGQNGVAIPAIDESKLKSDLAGKKKGEVQNYISAMPGIQAVDVKFGPFWVNKVPSKANKVTVEFKQIQD